MSAILFIKDNSGTVDQNDVKKHHETYKNKSKIEFRIKDAEIENYACFDLSELSITDEILIQLFN